MYIEDIAQVYEEEELNFATDEEEQRIRFKMNTKGFAGRVVHRTHCQRNDRAVYHDPADEYSGS